MKNNDYPIEKKLRCKLYITLVLYVVIGFVLTLLLGYVFSLSKNPVIVWMYWRMDVLFIFHFLSHNWFFRYLLLLLEKALGIFERNCRSYANDLRTERPHDCFI